MVLEAKNLSKSFRKKTAIDDVSFKANAGEILGIVGPRGSGKTTILKLIMGIKSADRGEILYRGDEDDKISIGYLSQEKGLYEKISVKKHLSFLYSMKGIAVDQLSSKVIAILKEYNIADYANVKVGDLPEIVRKRVEFMTAIINNPELLILDEPFLGIDYSNFEFFKKKLIELKKRGTTIVFTSSKIEEIDNICDRIIILKKGRIIKDDYVEKLKDANTLNHSIYIKTAENIKPFFSKLNIEAEEEEYLEYKFNYTEKEQLLSLNREIANANIEIIEMKHIENTLKQIYEKELEE